MKRKSGFLGRKKELKRLDELWRKPGFKMPVIYGRKGVGKTRLLREFAKDKPAIFYMPGTDERENVQRFRKLLAELDIACPSDKWREMFQAVFRKARDSRFALIIDDFPHLAKSNPDILAALQYAIDDPESAPPLFLVLCGSSVSFMKYSVLGYDSPLYGRRGLEFEIRPFSVFDSAEFLPEMPFEELCKVYGMTDGTPQYLRLLDDNLDFQGNLREKFLNPAACLFGDAIELLNQELKDPYWYSQILNALAACPLKLSEIANKMEATGIERGQCESMVRDLRNMGILKAAYPDNRFWIDDLYFRFWHRFVPKVEVSVRNERPDAEYIAKDYPRYMQGVFEKICEQWMLKKYAKAELPINLEGLGRLWRADSATNEPVEIGIAGRDFDGNAIFCECQWRDEPAGAEIIANLRRKAGLFKDVRDKYFYVFSKSGFSDDCLDYGRDCGQISLEKMFDAGDAPVPQVMALSF